MTTYTIVLTHGGYDILADGQPFIQQRHRWDQPGWVPLAGCTDEEKQAHAQAAVDQLTGDAGTGTDGGTA